MMTFEIVIIILGYLSCMPPTLAHLSKDNDFVNTNKDYAMALVWPLLIIFVLCRFGWKIILGFREIFKDFDRKMSGYPSEKE